jgi:hypothetical protein
MSVSRQEVGRLPHLQRSSHRLPDVLRRERSGQLFTRQAGRRGRIIDPSHAQVPLINAIIGLEAIPTLTGSMQSMMLAGMELISHSSGHFRKWLSTRYVDDMATGRELIEKIA